RPLGRRYSDLGPAPVFPPPGRRSGRHPAPSFAGAGCVPAGPVPDGFERRRPGALHLPDSGRPDPPVARAAAAAPYSKLQSAHHSEALPELPRGEVLCQPREPAGSPDPELKRLLLEIQVRGAARNIWAKLDSTPAFWKADGSPNRATAQPGNRRIPRRAPGRDVAGLELERLVIARRSPVLHHFDQFGAAGLHSRATGAVVYAAAHPARFRQLPGLFADAGRGLLRAAGRLDAGHRVLGRDAQLQQAHHRPGRFGLTQGRGGPTLARRDTHSAASAPHPARGTARQSAGCQEPQGRPRARSAQYRAGGPYSARANRPRQRRLGVAVAILGCGAAGLVRALFGLFLPELARPPAPRSARPGRWAFAGHARPYSEGRRSRGAR